MKGAKHFAIFSIITYFELVDQLHLKSHEVLPQLVHFLVEVGNALLQDG